MNIILAAFRELKSSTKGRSAVGILVTAFTIFSHTDTFISLSQKIRYVVELWREIIAFPWLILASMLSLDIPKTIAGLFTVLLATSLVVKSSWVATNTTMTQSARLIGVASCVFVGFLYSTLVIVPALYDANTSSFDVANIAIDVLADIYYVDVDTVDSPESVKFIITTLILLVYFSAMTIPFYYSISTKPRWRLVFGCVLAALFFIVMVDRLIYSFLPISFSGDSPLEAGVLFVTIVIIIFASFTSSVYLSDPATIKERNFSISVLLIALLFLNEMAKLIEWISATVEVT